MDIENLFDTAVQSNASDVHIHAGNPPILRINGELTHLKIPALTSEQVDNIIQSIMDKKQKEIFSKDLEIDFSIYAKNGTRFRVNVYNTLNGSALSMRKIPTKIMTLEEINAPKILEKLSGVKRGLLLISGPNGSGKSTTVAAIIDHINKNYTKHILTLEDPIEFVFKSDNCLISQREIGKHSHGFTRALKSSFREDSDVIVVSELRDKETISLALNAAETGHYVIGTVNSGSAIQTLDCIIDNFSSTEQSMIRMMLSNTLQAVISQNLLRKKDGNGRIAAFEVMIGNSAIRNLIREGKLSQLYSTMQVNTRAGMKIMKESISDLLSSGLVTPEAAHEALNEGDEMITSKATKSEF
jgi:twitching motility protein PilT